MLEFLKMLWYDICCVAGFYRWINYPSHPSENGQHDANNDQ